MPAAFEGFARFYASLFLWADARLTSLRASPFLGLAYAELKVNFVEGYAVLCLRRLRASPVSMASPFLWADARLTSLRASPF